MKKANYKADGEKNLTLSITILKISFTTHKNIKALTERSEEETPFIARH
jgi:hypothetical protein